MGQNLIFQLLQNTNSSQEKALSQKEKNERLHDDIRKFEKRNRGMKKKINDALLLNLGHGVIDKMDSGKDADEMKALRLMLREVVGGKKKVLKPSKRIAKLGEESDFEAETE